MKLPNAEEAIVDLRKLRDYCLSPEHERGKHKARVFHSVLGFSQENAQQLREALLEAVLHEDARQTRADQYGVRYVVDFEMSGPSGRATVRSGWIVRSDEEFPRLTSCYVI